MGFASPDVLCVLHRTSGNLQDAIELLLNSCDSTGTPPEEAPPVQPDPTDELHPLTVNNCSGVTQELQRRDSQDAAGLWAALGDAELGSPPSSPTASISVRLPSGSLAEVQLRHCDCTSANVKVRLLDWQGIPTDRQWLYDTEGRELADSDTVQAGDHLELRVDPEAVYMDAYLASSTPSFNQTAVDPRTDIQVQFQPNKRSDQLSLAPFLFWGRGQPKHMRAENGHYQRCTNQWTHQVLSSKFHLVELAKGVREQLAEAEYHAERNNGGYCGGDDHSWQRYTDKMPLAGSVKLDTKENKLVFKPEAPFRAGVWHAVVLQHHGGIAGIWSDLVIPFKVRGVLHNPQPRPRKGRRKSRQMIPSSLFGPITQAVMRDPVIAADGHTYERSAIERWLLEHDTSPLTNEQLAYKWLRPNHVLRSVITELGNHPEFKHAMAEECIDAVVRCSKCGRRNRHGRRCSCCSDGRVQRNAGRKRISARPNSTRSATPLHVNAAPLNGDEAVANNTAAAP